MLVEYFTYTFKTNGSEVESITKLNMFSKLYLSKFQVSMMKLELSVFSSIPFKVFKML